VCRVRPSADGLPWCRASGFASREARLFLFFGQINAAFGGLPGMSAGAVGSAEAETVAESIGQRASVSAFGFGFAVTRRSAAPALVLGLSFPRA